MSINGYYELEPQDNHFYSVFVDITHRCNMECANCYIPNRLVPDMDESKLYEALSKFPSRTEIRLIGGEPTVRPDLIDIVAKIKELGHKPTMMTNGLMLARPGYARALAEAGMRSIYISVNGADDDDVYQIMDGNRCADRKVQGWKEAVAAKMNVNLGVILQKGTNDHVPARLFEMVKEIGGNPVIRFRNVGQIGRYTLNKNQNWTWDELLNNVCSAAGLDPEWAKEWNTVNGFTEEHTILFPMYPEKKFKTPWIKITDWSPTGSDIPDPGSKRRGRLTQDFKLAPHWEHVKLNENLY